MWLGYGQDSLFELKSADLMTRPPGCRSLGGHAVANRGPLFRSGVPSGTPAGLMVIRPLDVRRANYEGWGPCRDPAGAANPRRTDPIERGSSSLTGTKAGTASTRSPPPAHDRNEVGVLSSGVSMSGRSPRLEPRQDDLGIPVRRDRKSTRLNSSHVLRSRMPSSA